MHGNTSRVRAKTAKLEFPPLLMCASDNREYFPFANQEVYTQASHIYSSAQKGYSTLPLPLPKGKYRVSTAAVGQSSSTSMSMSTLFPYPPIPAQNPKLKLLKSTGVSNTNQRKFSYTEQGVSLAKARMMQKNPDNNGNILKTTISIPMLPNKSNKKNAKTITPPKIKTKAERAGAGANAVEGTLTATATMPSSVELKNNAALSPSGSLSPLVGAKLSENHGKKKHARNSNSGDRLRVLRTEKEREVSPDCIRLENMGLKHFPIVGGEESHLRVFSLQHNLISRLDNLPPLTHLLVLDLYNNRVERITGLHGLPSLKVLLLGKNRIRRIEGLDALKRLEILDLHGNQLRYVDNLAALSSLRVLNLAGNLICTIKNLGPYGLSSLMELNLKRNRIKSLEGLQKAPHIKKLFLANNDLQSFSALQPLRKLIFLQELLLDANPLCSLLDYNSQILTIFPLLEILDKTPVSDQMRLEAKAWQKQRLAAEEEKRKELEKLHATLGSTRDEVIFEAKRRWESLKHFVRNNSVDREIPISTVPRASSSKHIKSTRNTPERQIKPAELETIPITPISVDIRNDESVEPIVLTPSAVSKKKISGTNTTTVKANSFEQKEQNKSLNNMILVDTDPASNIIDGSDVNDNSNVLQNSTAFDDPEIKESIKIINNSAADLKHNVIAVGIANSDFGDERKVTDSIDTPFEIDHSGDISKHTEVSNSERINPSELIRDLPVMPRSNSKLAKVAVVRPLLRSSKTIERPPLIRPTTSFTNPNFRLSVPAMVDTTKIEENDNAIEEPILPKIVQIDEIASDSSSGALEDDINVISSELQNFNQISTQTTDVTSLLETGGKLDEIENVVNPEDKAEIPILISNETHRSLTPLRRSKSTVNLPHILDSDEFDDGNLEEHSDLLSPDKGTKRPTLKNLRSSSVDVHQLSGDGESDTSDIESVATSTNTSDISSRRQPRRQISRTKWRVKTARQPSAITTFGRRPVTCQRDRSSSSISFNKPLRRTDSAVNLETISTPVLKRQGSDYLVEIDGKVLSIFGQGALKHTLHGFSPSISATVTSVHFHFISFDAMIPYFGKLKQVYPALDVFHFRSNNICTLGQLNGLADLQGIVSLQISPDGNPIVENPFWKEYAVYRLAHWGLQYVNGKEITSEYRGGGRILPEADYKMFESLGYLALSCLPQTALKPLAKRLHTLHCFCCCSPSSSSDESGKKKIESNVESSGTVCNAWDDDPVLLDVIGKEALVYNQPADLCRAKESQDVALKILNDGEVILEKLDMLEKVWPSMMCEAIQDILTDYMFMDNYMKKGLKALSDELLSTEKFK